MNYTQNSTFSKIGENALYHTVNSEYGSTWVQDGSKTQQADIKTAKVPTYSEIYESMNDFRKAERLIKSKIVHQRLQSEGINFSDQNQKFLKRTEFPIKSPQAYTYPQHGLKVGPLIYRTNNMNYGSNKPAQFELSDKYFPNNHSFTKIFCGGNFRFNGLNTAKSVSNIHETLNEF